MTLRKKTLVVVAIAFAAIIALLYFTSMTVFLGNLIEVEEGYTRQDTLEALNALSGEVSSLETKARDWSVWDDTYAFIEDANSAYIQSNLVDSTFTTLNINVIMFINSSGGVVFSEAFDLNNKQVVPVPLSLDEPISKGSLLVPAQDAEVIVSGIMLLDENPIIITSQPILTSNGEGLSRGRLIMGRYLDTAEVELLIKQTLFSLTIRRFDDQAAPSDFQLAKSSITEAVPIFIRPLDEQSIAGYAILEDIYGNPGLILRVDAPRDIYQQAKSNTLYFIWLRVLIGLALAVGIVLFLEKQVLSRLNRLSHGLSRISASKDPSARVSMSGKDELASLANTINGTLEALQQSQSTLSDSEARYRTLFEQSSEAIFITTRDGKYTAVNKSALDLLGYSREEILQLNAGDTYANAADRQEFQQQVEKKGSIKDYEMKMRRKDGRLIDCLVTSSVQLADDGSIIGYQSIIRDITEGKKAQETLLIYKMAAENSADLISIINSQYVFLVVNPTFLKYFGLNEDQVIGHDYAEVLGEELFNTLKPNIDRCFRGETIEYEVERNYPALGKRHIEVFQAPLKASDGHVVAAVSTVRDITERKQAEELFRTLANKSLIGIYISQEGKFQYANAPFAEIVDYSPAHLFSLNPLDLVFPEDRERVRVAAISMLKGESSHSYEYRIVESSGGIKWVMETVASIQYRGKRATLGNFVDITQRKKIEEELRSSEERLRTIFESVPDGVALNDLQCNILQANDAMAHLHQLNDGKQLIGRKFFEFIPEETHNESKREIERLIKLGHVKDFRVNLKRKDSSEFPVELSASIIRDGSGTPIGFVAVVKDITERKRAEEQLNAAYTEERELRQKLEEEINKRVEFTRALVHELKTPLTPVMASSELLASELHEEPWLSLAKNIHRSAGNLNDRIDELLDIARGEIGMLKLNPGPIDPLSLLKDVAQNVNAMIAHKGQTLSLDLPSSLTTIQGDEERLRQVLLNLLNNASKYTPSGGKITIRAKERDNSLIVEIEDTGHGISREDQRQLFTTYHHLENESQRLRGLGLGLALSKTLVELHGGKIWSESDKGKGSIFAFSLPLGGNEQSK